jgi:AbrB family looped-hinge helix DNA binding protein
MILTGVTPKNQVTIPRSILKKMDIKEGCEVSIEVVNGMVIIRKMDNSPTDGVQQGNAVSNVG